MTTPRHPILRLFTSLSALSFVALSAALALPACDTSVTGPPEECPEAFPDNGPCETEGKVCSYDSTNGCRFDYTCSEGTWIADSECATECLDPQERYNCLTPGEHCNDLVSECTSEDWTCGADHLWVIEETTAPDCCEPYQSECPAAIFEGDPCFPSCIDECVVESQVDCGTASSTFTCGDDSKFHLTEQTDCG